MQYFSLLRQDVSTGNSSLDRRVDENKHRPIYISGLIIGEFKEGLRNLLREFKDCFAEEYDEMPGLSRDLVEHRIPIMEGYKPYKQPPRRMSAYTAYS